MSDVFAALPEIADINILTHFALKCKFFITFINDTIFLL